MTSYYPPFVCRHAFVPIALNCVNAGRDTTNRLWLGIKNNRFPCLQPFWRVEPKVTVAKSGVQGWGLFARTKIKEGEVVCRYTGRLV